MKPPAGLRLIIGYKLVKAAAQLVLAVLVLDGARHGMAAWLERFAEHVQRHAVNVFSIKIGAALVRLASAHGGLWRLGLALAGDGLFTALEGWALLRGYAWAPWLVVIATATLIPFEIAFLVRHPHAGRFVLLAVNVAIVAYLSYRARRARAGALSDGDGTSAGRAATGASRASPRR